MIQKVFECFSERANKTNTTRNIRINRTVPRRKSQADNEPSMNRQRNNNARSTVQESLCLCALFFATCRCLKYTTQVENFKLTKSQLPIVVHISVYTDSRSVFPGRWVTYFGAHCEIRPNVGHGTIDQCARSIT